MLKPLYIPQQTQKQDWTLNLVEKNPGIEVFMMESSEGKV